MTRDAKSGNRLAWAALAGLLGLGFAAMLALNLPGQLSYDSVVQLWDGRSGYYDTWHPPVMAWLLGLGDAAFRGTALFLLFEAALLAGAWIVFLGGSRPGWRAVIVAALILATPQFLLYQGIVWKDVLFANAGIAAFAALAGAARHWRDRWPWLGAGLLCVVLAALARQNGLLLPPLWALTLALIAARMEPAPGSKHALAYGAGFLVLGLGLVGAAGLALARHGDGGDGAAAQIRLAQSYDLVGAVARDPGLALPVLAARDPALDKLLRSDGVRLYSPRLVDTLEQSQPLTDAINHAPPGVVFAAWRGLVFSHPVLYLRERLPVFLWVLAPQDIMLCHPDVVGVDGPPDILKSLGMTAHIRAQDAFLYRYVAHYFHTPVFSHLLFAGLALVLLVALLKRRRAPDLAAAGLLVSALAFGISFFVVSIACDYRYLYFLDLSAMTVALYYAASALKSRDE